MKKAKKKIIAVSGAFDPIHIGHIRYMQEAKKLGNQLIVILNNDNWIRMKKGKEFMGEEERKEIIEALACVDKVLISGHKKGTKDKSVCREIVKIKPHVFANGGDRFVDDIPEFKLCKKLGIEMVFNVGQGGKVQSSSDLLKNYQKHLDQKAQKLAEKYHQYNKKKGSKH